MAPPYLGSEKIGLVRFHRWSGLKLIFRTKLRSSRGSALSEFGPALFMLFVFGLLPVLDTIFLGLDYAGAYSLNQLQLREAQKTPRSQALALTGPIMSTIPLQWRSSLLGMQSNQNQDVLTAIDYQPVPWQPVGSNQTLNFWFVTISTSVGFRPFFPIPFLNSVPGLGAPITFTVSGRRPVENNRFLNE
jgi:hypothetical protein